MSSLHQINGTVGFHSADLTSVMAVCSLFKRVLNSQGQYCLLFSAQHSLVSG